MSFANLPIGTTLVDDLTGMIYRIARGDYSLMQDSYQPVYVMLSPVEGSAVRTRTEPPEHARVIWQPPRSYA